MAVLVTWKVSESRFVSGESAYRVYEVTGVANELEALSACQYQQGTSHPSDSRLLARVPEVTTLAGKTLYRVAVTWYRPKGTTTPPGTTKLGTRTMEWDIGNTTEPIDIAANGEAILNSAGSRFEPPPSSTITTMHLNVSRWESTFDPIKAMIYSNKVNIDQFSIFDHRGTMIGTVEPGQIKCDSITEAGYDEAEDIFRVRYTFELRELGFDHRILDTGNYGWFGNPAQEGKFIAADGEVLTNVRLDGTGKPMDSRIKVRQSKTDIVGATPVARPARTPQLWPMFSPNSDGSGAANLGDATYLFYQRYARLSFHGLDL
jgi:hypothetical protein